MNNEIPVVNPKARYLRHQKSIESAVFEVLGSGRYIRDAHVGSFERDFAQAMRSAHCIGVATGTDAIFFALKALGIGTGDEVITVAHTAVATVAAIELTGARARFVDIEPDTLCLDSTLVAAAITPATKAIVPVHIYGQPARMPAIMKVAREHGVHVVEDCAQSHGASRGDQPVGSSGACAAYSFYPTKNLGCFGDGGAITTNDQTLAERLRLLTQYGWRERYITEIPGSGNSRLDEIHAATLSHLLTALEGDNERRRGIAALYSEACLASGTGITPPYQEAGTRHAFHLYVVRLQPEQRDRFRSYLASLGIHTALHYPLPIHQQPAYQHTLRDGESLPETDTLYRSIVSLPMYPELSENEVQRVCDALAGWRD